MAEKRVIIWKPQPGPQHALITCPVFEVFYGGARGGGKTDGMLGDWIAHAGKYGNRASGLMVRRTREELYDTVERSKQLYNPLGARLVDNVWRFPDGARLRFAYLEHDKDAEAYQGHNYTRVYVEEAGNFPNQAPIMKLMATLRSASGVPVGFRATGNPGGPGHQWVKARYIDPAPTGYKIIIDDKSGLERVYIPARVKDNEILCRTQPNYVNQIKMSGNETLVKAWLDGDWNVISGAFFTEFSAAKHIINPFEIPDNWIRFRAGDWGSARPFSIGWYAISDGEILPRGSLVKYREWYGWNGEPNQGIKMVAEEVAKGIKDLEAGEIIKYGVMDPAAFSSDGGPSIAERMFREGVTWRKADNARVSRNGAMGGWDQLRARLKGEDGKPMIYFFHTCVHTIRTLPALQHDSKKPEDVDSEQEDHAPDETRYACMSRPYTPPLPESTEPMRGPMQMTMNEAWKTVKPKVQRI